MSTGHAFVSDQAHRGNSLPSQAVVGSPPPPCRRGRGGNKTLVLWMPVLRRPAFRRSAVKLAQYLAVRRRDIRALQDSLSRIGLSSLGRIESGVLPALDSTRRALDGWCTDVDTSPHQHKKSPRMAPLRSWVEPQAIPAAVAASPDRRASRPRRGHVPGTRG